MHGRLPDAVADWHRDAVKLAGPTSANHAARVIRALYKRRAKRDLRLSKVNIPTAAVEMHTERGEQKGMAAKDFPAWFKAWQAIESACATGVSHGRPANRCPPR